MDFIVQDKTVYFDRKTATPAGGIKTYFPNIKCYRNIISNDWCFFLILLGLLCFSSFQIAHDESKSWLVFGLFSFILLVLLGYILLGNLLSSGVSNVIACIHVDSFHHAPHHIINYFSLTISILTFGAKIDKEKEETLLKCLWVYHLANKNITWHFFIFKALNNYLFLNLFIYLLFIERSLSTDITQSLLPYYLIFASIVVTYFTAIRLSAIHNLIIKKLPDKLRKIGPILYTIRTPDNPIFEVMTNDIFQAEFINATYKVDRMGSHILFLQFLLPVFMSMIVTYLKGAN